MGEHIIFELRGFVYWHASQAIRGLVVTYKLCLSRDQCEALRGCSGVEVSEAAPSLAIQIIDGESGVVRSAKEVIDVTELELPGRVLPSERDNSGLINCPSGLNADRNIGRATSKAVRLRQFVVPQIKGKEIHTLYKVQSWCDAVKQPVINNFTKENQTLFYNLDPPNFSLLDVLG
ncbi:hypothetical protein K503DRAFT_812688 [Rhizopogon vinicolor AM-OR11-026]|uniref:Uncharacterized protein n=1 Tax=Rhizopogon vinicolor AM-OR11-026 TaxID=1314800 RepID=A0A1B7N3Q9_9AGAM|nr:hypothetical protein K503DRAFT_812688 [Rhizopogon vinicolor AM-OR11-026]